MDPVDARQLAALSEIANAVAADPALTRSALAAATGVSRATVSARVDRLIAAGVLVDSDAAQAGRGRPASTLRLNRDLGVVAAVDLGAVHCRVALADLGGEVLGESVQGIDIGEGPEPVLGRVDEMIRGLVDGSGREPSAVRAIGIGVPGPVAFASGTVVRPPIMPGWDGYALPGFFTDRYAVPVLVDNDVNMMALGEFSHRREGAHLLYVKVGTGFGCGIVSDGVLHRGATGAAGDIGHIRVAGHEEKPCHCGGSGCVEAVASGRAIAAALREAGLDARGTQDVVRLVAQGDPVARRRVRLAGRQIGEVIAVAVSFHNPDTIVLGGSLSELHEDLLAEIRAVVYRRALPLATRSLSIQASGLGARAGVLGAARLALSHLLAPAGLNELLSARPALRQGS